MKLLFFDLETTGVKFWRNGIHQIGGIVDIDGQEVERFDIRLAPNPAATIEQEALDVAGVTLEQVQSYQPMEEGYRQLVGILSKYVNKFDKRDKMYLVGYNNAGFDNSFLRALFQQCGDKYFGSWFYPNCMDVYVMVTPFLMGVRIDDRGNKATMLNDSILIVCTCLEYPEKYKMEVINIKNK